MGSLDFRDWTWPTDQALNTPSLEQKSGLQPADWLEPAKGLYLAHKTRTSAPTSSRKHQQQFTRQEAVMTAARAEAVDQDLALLIDSTRL